MYERDTVWERRRGQFRAAVVHDVDGYHSNPRENDCNSSLIVVPSTRYTIGETESGEYLASIARHAMDTVGHRRNWEEIVARYLRVCFDVWEVMVVHHEGGTGVIFDTPERRKETGVERENMRAALEAEWKEYELWAAGEVYGYCISRYTGGEDDEDEDEDDFEELDSCWGFIGEEWCKQSAIDTLDYYLNRPAEQASEQANNQTPIESMTALEVVA